MSERLGRIAYFMGIAKLVAKRSTCKRAQVGAVLVDPSSHRIVATGYNGGLKNAPHCLEVGCLMRGGHCVRALHAELNAVLHLERRYHNLLLFTTHKPCFSCFKTVLAVNVSKIFFLKDYPDPIRDELEKEIEGPDSISIMEKVDD